MSFAMIPATGTRAKREMKEIEDLMVGEEEKKQQDVNSAITARHDAQEVANLRGRRRRNRERRHERKENGKLMLRTTLGSLFSEELHTFADAVVNPFDQSAIGAIMPDQWQPPTIPALDRLNFQLDPTVFADATGGAVGTVIFAIVPRSLATGWWDYGGANGLANVPFYDLGPNLGGGGSPGYPIMARYPYVLVMSVAVDGAWTALTGGAVVGSVVEPGYNSVAFSRSSLAGSNLAACRMVGAGLKVWSDDAPINTGGTAYGGWITPDALKNSLGNRAGGSAPGVVQDELRFRTIKQGVEGVTVRYSPLQSAEQENFVEFSLPDSLVAWDPSVVPQDSVKFGENYSPFVYDQVNPTTSIPCVVWKFTSAQDLYALRVQSVVHLQGRPMPLSPFMQVTPKPDPLYSHLAMLLENKDAFPVSTGGHSFKKFLTKAFKHAQRLFRHADDVSKFLELSSGLASRFM